MKKIIVFFLYSAALLVIGRNVAFLPQFSNGKPTVVLTDIKPLKKQVLDFVNNHHTDGLFSVYYKNIITGQDLGINEHEVVTAASLNKIFIAAYLFQLAQEKKIDLEEKIVIQENDIQDYGTGVIRYQDPGQTYSLRSLAQLSLENSDNTAAHVLGIRLGMDNIQNFIKNLGLSATSMDQNETSAADMGNFFYLLYTNKIISAKYVKEILDYLKDTEFEDRIPKYLGDSISVYHKTGDAVNIIHDAGIIDDGKNPFTLAILVHDVSNEEQGKDDIGKIAQLIYGKQ